MAENYYRKPVPKSQKEISKNLQTPYDAQRGNPNDASEGGQFNPENQANIPFNRSTKMSFKGDTVKPFSIGIKDIDESIMYYFDNVIRPYVVQNGERIAVPIIYGSPERWKSIQKDAYYRDKKGAIMMPIIMFKRTSIEKNRTLSRKLDANSPNLYTFWQKSYNNKNFYSNFNLLNNKVPTKQYIANVVPDYVNLTYSFVVWTQYVQQMNTVVEQFLNQHNRYWGDNTSYRFLCKVDGSVNDATTLEVGGERLVKSEFTVELNGYLIPETISNIVDNKKFNAKKVREGGRITFSERVE